MSVLAHNCSESCYQTDIKANRRAWRALLGVSGLLVSGFLLGWLLATTWPGYQLRLALLRHRGPCNYTVADWLRQRERVLCMVATEAALWDSSGDEVRDTWWARCDHLVFLSSQPHPVVPTVVMNSSQTPWSQIRKAFEFAVSKTEWDYDWILKVDDKTFVIMENLRLLLSLSPPYGVAFTGIRTGKYQLRTSTGYVISREAAQELVIKGHSYALCRDAAEEDDGLVFCMAALEGNFFDAEDGRGLPLLYDLPPEALMEKILWEGMVDNCCSVKPALFHGLSPSEMRATQYLLYHLKPQPPMTSITCLPQQ